MVLSPTAVARLWFGWRVIVSMQRHHRCDLGQMLSQHRKDFVLQGLRRGSVNDADDLFPFASRAITIMTRFIDCSG